MRFAVEITVAYKRTVIVEGVDSFGEAMEKVDDAMTEDRIDVGSDYWDGWTAEPTGWGKDPIPDGDDTSLYDTLDEEGRI